MKRTFPLPALLMGAIALVLLAACAGTPTAEMPIAMPVPSPVAKPIAMPVAGPVAGPVAIPVAAHGVITVKLIAFNDLHGNLEPPKVAIVAPDVGVSSGPSAVSTGPGVVSVPAGGVAYMATAIKVLRARNPNNAVVTAGDLVGASPLVSGLFLDEPTIEAANAMHVDFSAVGNHEFDKGQDELLRLVNGGCQKITALEPCRMSGGFTGARFTMLAANVLKPDGNTLMPATGIKTFGSGAAQVRVGFIGMTLRGTPDIVAPAGVKGLRFEDEADTANALVPKLRAQGAKIIVLLIHQGGMTSGGYNDKSCPGFRGQGYIQPVLDQLDPTIDVVVSGHTHRAYICDYGKINPAKPFLLTSAGSYGTLLTDIDLDFDLASQRVVARRANNVIVQGEGFVSAAGASIPVTTQYQVFPKDGELAALVDRYKQLAAPLAQRPVGSLQASLTRQRTDTGESSLGNLIADAQLAATRSPANGGAQIALMNPGGLRADLVVAIPGGVVTYGQLFSVQPFGNNLMVKSMSGALLHTLLEQQFASGSNSVATPRVLFPSKGFSYNVDLAAPAGSRVSDMTLDGVAVDAAAQYRVTMNNYLADGGDNFDAFKQGTATLGGPLDLEALEQFFAGGAVVAPPDVGRIRKRLSAP